MHVFQFRLPLLEIILRVVQDLSSLIRVLVRRADVTWDDWGVIEEVEETTTVAGEDNLLLGTLDGGGELQSVCFLELLAGLRYVSGLNGGPKCK